MAYNQQAWEELIKRTDKEHENDAPITREEFLAKIDRVEIWFNAGGYRSFGRLLNYGLEVFKKDGFDYYEGAYIPAITSPEFMVYIPARIVPDEFIKEFVATKIK